MWGESGVYLLQFWIHKCKCDAVVGYMTNAFVRKNHQQTHFVNIYHEQVRQQLKMKWIN